MLVPTSDHQEVLFSVQVEISMYCKVYLGILYLCNTAFRIRFLPDLTRLYPTSKNQAYGELVFYMSL